MTSTPRLTNGQPPTEKMPRAKPHKAKKPPKKVTAPAPDAVIAKPAEMEATAPIKAAPAKPPPPKAKPMAAMPMAPKMSMPPMPSFDSIFESFECSCKAAGQGAQALNAKLFDMARANMTSGFNFMTSLASARHPSDIARLQMDYWDERMRTLLGQARELRALSAEIVAKANEPIRAQLKQSFKAAA